MKTRTLAVSLCVLCSAPLMAQTPPWEDILRGDANNDHAVTTADTSYILNYLFYGGSPPPCMDQADVDDNGVIQMADAIRLNNYLFSGGPAPAAPFPYCGADTTADYLFCPDSACD